MAADDLETRIAGRFRRDSALPAPPNAEGASAAVSVILAGPELELALIRRATDERDPWSGHMALPGGRRDPVDVNLHATAVRETREEVGIELEPSTFWGELASVGALSGGRAQGLRVAPFLFRLAARPPVVLNHEVAELLWVPLGALLDDALVTDFRLDRGEESIRFPAWNVQGHPVWGLTHRILSQLLELEERPIRRESKR